MWGLMLDGNWLRDLRHTLRVLRKRRGFTIAAIATLSLGIGTNSAIFSVVSAVLLNPLTYPDPNRIVQFLLTSPRSYPVAFASIPAFKAWAEQTNVFQDVTGYDFPGSRLNLTDGDAPEQVGGTRVTANYFRLFGVPVERGRAFTAEEDTPNGPRVVLISDGLWRRRYGADPDIIGKPIQISGDQYVIVGVVGRGFVFDESPDVWIPFRLDLHSMSQTYFFAAAGRLKPGVTLAQANARLSLAAGEFHRRFPNSRFMGPGDGFYVEPLLEAMVRNVRPSLWILMVAVALVLLIACANVANLMQIRATGRSREIAIRVAVGAGRGSIVRQLLAESVALSAIGGALGLALGMVAVRVLLVINPGDIPRIGESGEAVGLDWRVFVFTAAISFGAGIFLGLMPALRASRVDLNGILKESAGGGGSGHRQSRVRSVLVAGEVSLAVVLLIGAALLIRSLVALRSVIPGFEPHSVLTMPMSISGRGFQEARKVAQLVRSGIERLETVPGVVAAGVTHRLPLQGAFNAGVKVPGASKSGSLTVGWNAISARYFEIYRIPLLRGRVFTAQDGAGSVPAAIINDALRKRFWSERDPIGQSIMVGDGGGPEFEEPARQIIGVVGDVHERGLGTPPRPDIYVPLGQITDGITAQISRTGPVFWIVRTQRNSGALASKIQNELEKATGLPVAGVRTMDEVVSRSTASQALNMLLMTAFGCSALLLAAVGIYGLMACSVQERTKEFGIRMALGARPSDLRTSTTFQGMRLAFVGVLSGTAGAFGLTRWMAFLLWGVKTWDALTFVAVPAILTAVAFIAVWVPALRATRIDPATALRCE
jgi:putative ABC transport system permease protein